MKSLCMLLLLVGGLSLERGVSETPTEIAAAYFRVVQSGDYPAAASFFEAGALGEFRGMMSFLNELPPEIAGEIFPQFFGQGESPASVEAMDDREFFARFLGGMMAQAEAMGRVSLDQIEILGSVPEGEDLVHVLTRSRATVGEMEIEGMEVISFRRTEEGWRALLSGKMKGMAAQLQQALQGPVELEEPTEDVVDAKP